MRRPFPHRPGRLPTWLVVALALLALLAVGAVLAARAVLYFGPDPAPRDYLAEHRRLSLELTGLDKSPERNGWPALQEALAALSAALASTDLPAQTVADDLFSRIQAGDPVEEAEIEAFRRLVARAAETGLSDAMDRLALAQGTIRPEPADLLSTDALEARGDLRGLARFLAAAAEDASNRGSSRETLPPLRHLLALARAVSDEPSLIDYLIAIALLDLALSKTDLALARVEFSQQERAILQRDLADATPPALHEVLRGEELLSLDMIAGVGVPGIAPKPVSLGYQTAQLERAYDEMIAFARLSPVERAAPNAPRPQPAPGRFAPNLADLAIPAMDNSLDVELLIFAHLAATRINAAICAHRADHGALPDSLTDLLPTYLDRLPTDPRDPEGIIYTRVEDPAAHGGRAYLLYAVGFDGVDNGGAHVPSDNLRDVYLAPGDPDHDFVFNPAPHPAPGSDN